MSIKIQQSNPNWLQRLQRRYTDAPKTIKVGYPEGTEAATVSYPDGTRVVDVAITNQYGDPFKKIPSRPFLSLSRKEIIEKCGPIIEIAVKALNDDEPDKFDRMLDTAGSVAAGIVKNTITELRDPPNSEETIARKKSSNPLIDTGLMRQTTTYKVVDI